MKVIRDLVALILGKIIYSFRIGPLRYIRNWICMVLFIENEAEHYLVKFFVVITLILLLFTGWVQLKEAVLSNEIASDSLNVSNKVAAYTLLSNENIDNDTFVYTYNLLSYLDESYISKAIEGKNLPPSYPIKLNDDNKKAKINVLESDVTFFDYGMKEIKLNVYESNIKFLPSREGFFFIGLNNSNASIYESCEGRVNNKYFEDEDYESICSTSKKNYLNFAMRGTSHIELNDIDKSFININFIDEKCRNLLRMKETKNCISKERSVMNKISYISDDNQFNKFYYLKTAPKESDDGFTTPLYTRYVKDLDINSINNTILKISNLQQSSKTKEIEIRDSNENYLISKLDNLSLSIVDSSLYYSSSSSSGNVFNILYSDFKYSSLPRREINSLIGYDFTNYYVYKCKTNMYENYVEYFYDETAFFEAFKCSDVSGIDYTDEGYFYRKNEFESYDDFLTEEKIDIKKYNEMIEQKTIEKNNLHSSIFNIDGESEFSIDNIVLTDTVINVDMGFVSLSFENVEFKNSLINFSSFDYESEPVELCKKVYEFLKNKNNYIGTNLKKENVRISFNDTCILKDELFSDYEKN